jgi:hypothetical protein
VASPLIKENVMKSEYMNVLAIFTTLLLLGTCSSCNSAKHKNRLFDTAVVGSSTVGYIESNIPVLDRTEAQESIKVKLSDFKEHFGKESIPVSVALTTAGSVECNTTPPSPPNTVFIGCSSGRFISAIMGHKNIVPAFFHELCHSNAVSKKFGPDPQHKDPLWVIWGLLEEKTNMRLENGR